MPARQNTTGFNNTIIGDNAGSETVTGSNNVYVGQQTGQNSYGSRNTSLGTGAGYASYNGNYNTYVGYQTGYGNVGGGNNTYLGYEAGSEGDGSNNVFLGYQAAYNEEGSNKLYIENSNSATPLIYGDFANDTVKIHGTLGIKNAYIFPIVDGTAGQVLQTNGSGHTSWTAPTTNTDNQKTDVFQLNGTNLELSIENDGIATQSIDLSSFNATKTIIADADNDTKIQVEESADEDRIRFDLGGSERVAIERNAGGLTLINLVDNRENVFLGQGAGNLTGTTSSSNGNKNSFIGYQAGYLNTLGRENVFNGYRTGYNNTIGRENVFTGSEAGYSNTSGRENVFDGYQAGYFNTTGANNVFTGNKAGYTNTTGGSNIFTGYQTGYSNTTGNNNLFNGNQAGYSNTTGYGNVFNGYRAGYDNTSGKYNLFNGYRAGYNNTTGDYNIFLGYQSGHNETGSNKLYIENSSSATPLIYGEFDNDIVKVNGSFISTGILYPNAGVNLPNAFAPDATYIGTAGNFISFAHSGVSEDFLGYKNNTFYFRDSPNGGDNAQPAVYAASFPTYSSRRWKHNIQNLNNALSIIQELQGVTYTWNEDHGGFEDFGFIAEEVNKVLPQIAKKGKDGQVDGVEYGKITPYLVEAMKEQQTIIETQSQRINQLEEQVQKINELESALKQLQVQLSKSAN